MKNLKCLLQVSSSIFLMMLYVVYWAPMAAGATQENPVIQIEKQARLAVFDIEKGKMKEIGSCKDAVSPLLIDEERGLTLIYGNPEDPDVIEQINAQVIYCYTITNHSNQSVQIRSLIDDNGTTKDLKDDIPLTPKLEEILGSEMTLLSGQSVNIESGVIEHDFTKSCEINSLVKLSAYNDGGEIKSSDSVKVIRNIAVFECPPDASASSVEDVSPLKTGAATIHSNCCGQARVYFNDETMVIGSAKEAITRTWKIEIICKDFPTPFMAECTQTIHINP